MKNYFEDIGALPRSHNVVAAYVVGFVLSLLLTLLAYALVVQNALPHQMLIAAIIAAALLQFIVQVYCFLHLDGQQGSRDRLIVFGFAALVVGILVSGSLWIMFSLNGRMMPDPAQMEQYMNNEGGF
ncbi:MAG TPA: cytochrome o ubiquinol oxidase subunit IV [Candidatus Paceibacterota bacterium]|jgi:cytochrome o ubiquinol oxidase operon protein cyoD|nr:cytochrome o ubiquinol oxidase subunit IV [Candidatus Paceibacterota bacterium]